MYRPRKTTLPLLGTTVALLVLITTLLACGPADESMQQEIGNLPVVAQEDPPAPAEDPTLTPEPAEQPHRQRILESGRNPEGHRPAIRERRKEGDGSCRPCTRTFGKNGTGASGPDGCGPDPG